jgi:putative ABC transport system permease protein
MYLIEHAFLNLLKNKGRNILLGLTLLAVISSVVIAVAIFNTSSVIIDDARIEFDSMVRIRPQTRQMGGNNENTAPQLTLEDFYNFADSDYISGSEITPGSSGTGRNSGIEAIYYLNSPEMFTAFVDEMREKGLPSDWSAYKDEAAFNRMIKPIESLQDVSLTFLIIVLVFGAAILILLSVISIRERKYEIGVLRAMGLKKKKVTLCLWIETIAITCICFVLGLIIGTALANPVSNALWTGDGQMGITLNSLTILQILATTIILATVAGVVSVSRITKYEPIKILMERD